MVVTIGSIKALVSSQTLHCQRGMFYDTYDKWLRGLRISCVKVPERRIITYLSERE